LERRDTWELLADSDEEGDVSDDGSLESGGNCKLTSAGVEGGESDETQDEELNSITEVFQTKGIVAMDETTDEESERELDDDQMMAMDEELALMFNDRVKRRKDKGVFSCLAQAASVDGYPRRSTERSDPFQKPDYGSFGHLR
jgi:DNA polymerase phi